MSCSLAHNKIGFQSPSLKVSWKTFIFTVSCHYFDASAQHNSESSRSYLVMLQAANLWTIVNYMEKWLYLKHFIFFLLVVKFSSCAEVDAVYAGWREGRRQECGGSTCSHPPELAIRYPLPLPTHHHQIPSDWPHLSNPLSQSTAGIVWTSHGLRPPSRHPHANTAGAGCRALGDGRWQRAGAIYIDTPSCYNDNMWWQSSTTPPDQIEKIASLLIWRTPLKP